MKRKHIILLVMLLALLVLFGCDCTHDWNDANCTQPKNCSICGETKGDPVGHQWEDATCTAPRTCSVCSETKGEALGHSWQDSTCISPQLCTVCAKTEGEALGHAWEKASCTEASTCTTCGLTNGDPLGHTVTDWTIVTESTCTEAGEESGLCTLCNQTVTQNLALKEHTAGSWTVSVAATATSNGIRIQCCTVCETELQSEEFSMSAEELEAQYKAQCEKIAYKSLERTPDQYKGCYVKFTGRVVQVCSEAQSSLYYSTYRVATSGRYKNVVLIYVDNYGSGSRILEGDKITFYGKYDGLYTYETVMGSSLSIPSIIVEYID